MTELTSAVNFNPYDVQDKYGSIGPPMPGNEILVSDECHYTRPCNYSYYIDGRISHIMIYKCYRL